jgi:hypothetical protein
MNIQSLPTQWPSIYELQWLSRGYSQESFHTKLKDHSEAVRKELLLAAGFKERSAVIDCYYKEIRGALKESLVKAGFTVFDHVRLPYGLVVVWPK